MVGVKFVKRKKQDPPVEKNRKNQAPGNRWEGSIVQIFIKKMKGVGANGRIHRKKYKRFGKPVTF